MKHTILLILFFTIFSFQAFSQSYNVKWGDGQKKFGNSPPYFQSIGVEGDFQYEIMYAGVRSYLLKFDMDYELLSKEEIDLQFEGQSIFLEKMVRTKNGLFGCQIFGNKKKAKTQIIIFPFKDGEFLEPKEVYQNTKEKNNKEYPLIFLPSSTKIIEGEDGGFVAFTNIMVDIENKRNIHYLNLTVEEIENRPYVQHLRMLVFDADMNLVWKKVQEFDYKFSIQDVRLDIKGKLHYFIDDKLISISKDSMTEMDIKVDNEPFVFSGKLFFPNPNSSNFILTGLYTTPNKETGLKGVYFVFGDIESGEYKVKLHKFPKDLLESLLNEKARGLPFRYKIGRGYTFSNGTIGFIAEDTHFTRNQYITSTSDSPFKEKTDDPSDYYSNNIIIPLFTSDGELIKIQKIQKEYHSQIAALTSYSSAFYEDKVFILYNNRKKQDAAAKINGKVSWHYTDLTVITKDGEIAYQKSIFNSNEMKLLLNTKMSAYSGQKFLIGVSKKNKYRFGVIDLSLK